MNVLPDTHSLIWYLDDYRRLSAKALATITDPANDIFISVASIWEISIKVGLGKLKLSLPYRQWVTKAINDLGATLLPLTLDYCDTQSRLPYHHGDPFDRMIIAQSLFEGMPVVGSDAIFDAYGVVRIW